MDESESSMNFGKLQNSETDSAEDTLDVFCRAFQQVYDRTLVSKMSFSQLHAQVYMYCLGIQTLRPIGLNTTGIKNGFRFSELYGKIKEFLERFVNKLENGGKDIPDEEILQYYSERWIDYQLSSSFLDSVCEYVNRRWVSKEREEGRQHIVTIYQLALVIWRDVMSRSIDKRVISAVLTLIEIERCGGMINTILVDSVINSYVGLGLNDYENNIRNTEQNLSMYKEIFENIFLEETRKFYTRVHAVIFEQKSILEYLTKVEMILQDEQKRVQTYLHKSSLDPLLQVCCKVLVGSRLDILLQKFKNMLLEKRYEGTELSIICKLVSGIPDVNNTFHLAIEEDALERGLAAIEKCGTEATNNPKLYVDAVLRVRREYALMVSKIFDNNPGCNKALDKACEKFVNYNYVTQLPNSSSTKSPELLVKYCDSLLKKSGTNLDADELEETLNQVMIVFGYIEDKDIFQRLYSRMLAKRLVCKLSTSDDAEESMISKMKQSCGVQYTDKLQRMFNDIALNKELNEKFRIHLTETEKSLDMDFDVQVLASGSWPFHQSLSLAIPIEVERSINELTTFYDIQFNGRKLTWIYQLCRGELVVNCFKKRYILQVSAFQMTILLLFNSADNYSLQQIEEVTKIKFEYLVQVIQLLMKSKLLISDCNENNLGPNTDVRLFLDYKNKKQRINLNMPLKMEVNVELDNVRKFVEQERRFLIQAAIIRTMKARKELQLQQLLSEVFIQLSSLFKPNDMNIKKCIDMLVDKEYLKRVTGDKNVYQYVA